MSVFLLPIESYKDLEMKMCKFWWRTDANKKRAIHWMNWENMCKKKSSGGIGFRDTRDFNTALFGKQVWRLLTMPHKLVSEVYKARYYSKGSILNAT